MENNGHSYTSFVAFCLAWLMRCLTQSMEQNLRSNFEKGTTPARERVHQLHIPALHKGRQNKHIADIASQGGCVPCQHNDTHAHMYRVHANTLGTLQTFLTVLAHI